MLLKTENHENKGCNALAVKRSLGRPDDERHGGLGALLVGKKRAQGKTAEILVNSRLQVTQTH